MSIHDQKKRETEKMKKKEEMRKRELESLRDHKLVFDTAGTDVCVSVCVHVYVCMYACINLSIYMYSVRHQHLIHIPVRLHIYNYIIRM